MERISLFLKEFWVLVIVAMIGVGILFYGLWEVMGSEQSSVEIVSDKNKEQSNIEYRDGTIVVDVAGAVEKPGVYKLPSGSRVGDALVVAGGLSDKADREWVAQTLNLASEVKDGEKVFIPKMDENRTDSKNNEQSNIEYRGSQGKVNINTASLAELDGLTGIGEVRAKTILDNRPYSKVGELVTKAKIPESAYEKIKDKVTIY